MVSLCPTWASSVWLSVTVTTTKPLYVSGQRINMTDKFGLPADAVAVNINVGVVANTTMNAVMPAVPGYLNVLRGFKITGTGATAASAIDVTTTGCGTAGPNLRLAVPAGVNTNAPNTAWSPDWPNGIPASAANTAITVSVPAFGAGNTGAAISLYGYRIRA